MQRRRGLERDVDGGWDTHVEGDHEQHQTTLSGGSQAAENEAGTRFPCITDPPFPSFIYPRFPLGELRYLQGLLNSIPENSDKGPLGDERQCA